MAEQGEPRSAMGWVHWLAVLPAAWVAAVAVGFVVGLLRPILLIIAGMEVPGRYGTVEHATVDVDGGDTVVGMVKVGLQACAFVFAGASVAPSRRTDVARLLSLLYLGVVGTLTAAMSLGAGTLNVAQVLGVLGLLVASLVGAAVAAAAFAAPGR